MPLKLTKIEAELWTEENMERFQKEQMKSFEYEDMKEWHESIIFPEYRNKALADVLNDICERSGFDTWSDFELHYIDTGNDDEYFFSYNCDGDLMFIDRNGVADERVTGKIGFETLIKEIESIPSVNALKKGG